MYMRLPTKFVYPENAFHLSERLIIQQGLFLCTGDIRARFEENLTSLSGHDRPENVVKLSFGLDNQSVRSFATQLRRMNIDSAALFPGLDGFSRSLGERVFQYV
jgi:hypothetical protein